MKSKIPWTNYCMRKYGKNLRVNIAQQAMRIISETHAARLLAISQTTSELSNQPSWIAPGQKGKV